MTDHAVIPIGEVPEWNVIKLLFSLLSLTIATNKLECLSPSIFSAYPNVEVCAKKLDILKLRWSTQERLDWLKCMPGANTLAYLWRVTVMKKKSLMTLTPDGSLEIQQLSFQFFEDFNKVDVKTERIYDACIKNVIQFEEQHLVNLINASQNFLSMSHA